MNDNHHRTSPRRPRLRIALVACAAACAASSCGTRVTDIPVGNWEKEAALVSGHPTATPPHSLPPTEYPFDASGNYLPSLAALGERRLQHGGAEAGHDHPAVATPPPRDRTQDAAPLPQPARTLDVASLPRPRRTLDVASLPRPQRRPPPAESRPAAGPASRAVTAPATVRYHKVTASDTLWGLSRKYDTTVDAIQRANGLTSDKIITGSTLKIPG